MGWMLFPLVVDGTTINTRADGRWKVCLGPKDTEPADRMQEESAPVCVLIGDTDVEVCRTRTPRIPWMLARFHCLTTAVLKRHRPAYTIVRSQRSRILSRSRRYFRQLAYRLRFHMPSSIIMDSRRSSRFLSYVTASCCFSQTLNSVIRFNVPEKSYHLMNQYQQHLESLELRADIDRKVHLHV